MSENILQEKGNRFSLFPIEYPKMYEFFQIHEANFWTTEEIDLKEDVRDWETKLNDDEKHFIKYVLAFFAASDGIVNENLAVNFYKKIPIAESRLYYTIQMLMESIHSQTYSVLIDTLVKDDKEKDLLFNAIQHIPVVQKKAEWAINYLTLEEDKLEQELEKFKNEKDSEKLIQYLEMRKDPNYVNNTFIKQLVAFIIVEGIFFSGSFCAIFWLKNRGLMPGLSFSNELISKDENLHCEYGIYLYSLLKNRLSESEIHTMFKEAVDIEKEFVCSSLPVSLIGMNSNLMSKYIEFVADHILIKMGYSKLYNVKECPFTFMELISFSGTNSKVNFFEKRNADYQRSGVGKTKQETELSFDEDF